jgi:hypothetical protein
VQRKHRCSTIDGSEAFRLPGWNPGSHWGAGSIPTAPTKSPNDSIGLVHRIPEKRSIKASFGPKLDSICYCFKATRTNVEVVKPPALRCTKIAFCESGRAIEASTTARRYPAKDCWLSPRRIPRLGCRTRMRAPATCAPQSSVHRAALGDNHRRPTFPSRKPTDLCSMQRSSQ